jgi:hypothetical protein
MLTIFGALLLFGGCVLLLVDIRDSHKRGLAIVGIGLAILGYIGFWL